jgi:large subunit ribosomal protein L18
MAITRNQQRRLRRRRVRRHVRGSDARPRLSVYRSLHHIYAQVISDESGRTLAAASTINLDEARAFKNKCSVGAARLVGKAIAEKCVASGIHQVIFDRNGFLYHGRVKALADAAREAGLRF